MDLSPYRDELLRQYLAGLITAEEVYEQLKRMEEVERYLDMVVTRYAQRG